MRKLIFIVCLSRIIRKDLGDLTIVKSFIDTTPSSHAVHGDVADFLNQLYGNTPNSEAFWSVIIGHRLQNKFGKEFLSDEVLPLLLTTNVSHIHIIIHTIKIRLWLILTGYQ